MDIGEEILNLDPKKYRFDCDKRCAGKKCDGVSKKSYNFANDLHFAELNENMVRRYILSQKDVKSCTKIPYEEKAGDLKVIKINDEIEHAEIKSQTRTFMKAKELLYDEMFMPFFPSETVTMNTSDFDDYISWQYNNPDKRMVVYWTVYNRPCVVEEGKVAIFKAYVSDLKILYIRDCNHRKGRQFIRQSGLGDIDENGMHLGVTTNLHFRLSEMELMAIIDIPNEIAEYIEKNGKF